MRCVRYVHLLALFAVIFTVLAFVIYFYVPHYFRDQISKKLPIVNSSESRTFVNWKSNAFKIVNNLYLFNVTNSEEVRNGHKPILQQLASRLAELIQGPFVFTEERAKRNITWLPMVNSSDKYSSVKYEQYKRWQFVPELSNGSLSDKIHHLNVPLVSAGNAVNSLIAYFGLNAAVQFTRSELFPVHTAGELLFGGYVDSFLKLAQDFNVKLPADRFGWFYGKNNSADGVFQIVSGTSGLKEIGKLISWRNQTKLDIWRERCNSLNNVYSGDIFKPFQYQTPRFLKMFVGELCRPLKLYFTGVHSTLGVTANRFMVTKSSLDNSLEENKCFCRHNVDCPASGLVDTGACMQDAPVGVSLPHFLFADSVYGTKIHGIQKPDVDRHGFFVDIEPTLGVPVRIAVRMQINVLLENNEHLDFSRNLNQSAYYPQIWFDASAGIDEDMAAQIRFLQQLPFYKNIFALILLATAIILVVVWLCLAYLQTRPKEVDVHYNALSVNSTTTSISSQTDCDT